MRHVVNELPLRLAPDAFWAIVEPLVPQFDPHPESGGTVPLDDPAVFTAIVYVLTSGVSCNKLTITWYDAHHEATRSGFVGVCRAA